MDKPFQVKIITPERTVFSGQVSSVVAPGEIGYLEILANHAPIISNLVKGKIVLKDSSNNKSLFLSMGNGFLQVFNNQVVLLLEKVSD
ncbi:MAG: F0F1 ATP synthase subunit epsilon [Candidatus Omnitrophica bacterium]|nr:F0F1 ATP synthase subunit epsilon [Candidatus Omnitrophota bacterium]